MKTTDKVWFITGCSTGLGRELAKQVLEAGGRVVMTARNTQTLDALQARHPERACALELDLTDGASILTAADAARQAFGHIDVLVNNAGYGYVAAIEEGEDVEIRRQFETNVFGLFALTRHVLADMRARRSGHILNLSSIGGLVAFGATGYYHATKFAVEGFSEALAAEVAPLGIKVTLVEPSGFRTDWAGRSIIESKTVIEDYAETAGARRKATRDASGKQRGDPARAAQAMRKVVGMAAPPLRLLLGNDAYRLAMARLETQRKAFEEVRELACGADFPEQ
jgi:NAD(P)-dependent dehydrogenase (short-subunit alcohol dehydrogenase family)